MYRARCPAPLSFHLHQEPQSSVVHASSPNEYLSQHKNEFDPAPFVMIKKLSAVGGSAGGEILARGDDMIAKRFYHQEAFDREVMVIRELTSSIPLMKTGLLFKHVDIYSRSRVWVIVMTNQFHGGETIKNDWIQPLSRRLKYKLISNLINGLHDLHSHGWIHGDVKESNVLVNTKSMAIQWIDVGSMENDKIHQRTLRRSTRSYLPLCLGDEDFYFSALSATREQKMILDRFALSKILLMILATEETIKPDVCAYLKENLARGERMAGQIRRESIIASSSLKKK